MSEQRESYTTNEQADCTARIFGVVLLLVGLGIAYFVWPTGVADGILAALTLGAMRRAVVAIAIGIASIVVAVMFWM